MAYDEGLAQRIRECLDELPNVVEKKMFGGLAFMIDGNMSVGVIKSELMLRVGPERYEQILALPYARKMDFTGKPLTGFVYVGEPGIESDEDLQQWVDRALVFNKTLPPK
jgi:TfoX/Sxy family transcriptional regulator of competence genes